MDDESIPMRVKIMDQVGNTASESAVLGLPRVLLITVTAPESCLPFLSCTLFRSSFHMFRFSIYLLLVSPISVSELLEERDCCSTHLWPRAAQ